jgi:hypothetical protein
VEITYLNKVVENPTLDGFTNRELSIENIEKLEEKYNEGKVFPVAFREFLFLAGEFNNFNFDDLGDGIDALQDLMSKELQAAEESIDRPFFAFSFYDSQYSVIALDENDEDPKVYLISPFLAAEDLEPLVKIPTGGFKENYTFTELINESIRRIKSGSGI